jgi:putative ABC transport system permease protein
MDLLNLCQQILHDMWARKLRSLLALFGIAWGTAAVILLTCLGHSFIQANQNKIMNLANGTLFINSDQTSIPYHGYPVGTPIGFRPQMIMSLPDNIHHIKRLTVDITQVSAELKLNNQHKTVLIHGDAPDYISINKIKLFPNSRNFIPDDIHNSRNVMILGSDAKNDLFGPRPAIGQKVLMGNSIPFLIIGVMTPQQNNPSLNNSALIPYTTWLNLWGNSNTNVNFFIVQPEVGYGEEVKHQLRSYLSSRFHFAPDDQVALQVFDTTAFSEFFSWFFMAIQVFLSLCGALTLGVGGIGVANIMFLIVTERTNEIGLRLAVGARDWQVMFQIILEAILIVGVGALIGFLFAFGCITILQLSHLPDWMGHPQMSWLSILATIVILGPLAILSGYFPAKNAARLDPVDALRK